MNEPAIRVLQRNTPETIRAELERVGADLSLPAAAPGEILARAQFYLVKLDHVALPLARLLFQELLMEGGQVVSAPRLEHVGSGETALVLCATRYQFNHLIIRLRWQPSDELQLLAQEIERALDATFVPPPPLELATARLDWARQTYIMGILNLTPDSFSGDGLIHSSDAESDTIARVLAHARQLLDDGADVLDIGGESTRPGATSIDAETELERVLAPLRALCSETGAPLSIDTTKPRVAAAALEAGAQLVNDVSGLGDPEMAHIVADHNAAVVIMHNGKPDPAAPDFITAMLDHLRARVEVAHAAGIAPARILIDPGLGFGKSLAQNLTILNRLGEFRALGCPILIGPSRKGFITRAIQVPVGERDEGTAAAVSVGILRGANMVRVHNVRVIKRIARMTDSIKVC